MKFSDFKPGDVLFASDPRSDPYVVLRREGRNIVWLNLAEGNVKAIPTDGALFVPHDHFTLRGGKELR